MGHIYFLSTAGVSLRNIRAAISLIRECYPVVHASLCPYLPGLIYETATPVSDLDKGALGLVDWQ